VPHVKLSPSPGLPELLPRLKPLSARDEHGVQKVQRFFMDPEGSLILAEALVAEGGLPRHFFLALSLRESLVIRCYASTDPEKTPAVKRLIARFGIQLAAELGSELDPCNLAEEVGELSP